MLLVFDVGNTNMVLGLYEDKELIKYWRINTDKNKTSDEYGILINNLFKLKKLYKLKRIPRILQSIPNNWISFYNQLL